MGNFEFKMSKGHKEGWWHTAPLELRILAGIGIGIAGIGALYAFGWVTMALWNWLMPEIFGLPRIGYWQTWGLIALSSIFFKNWGGDGDARYERRRKKSLKRMVSEEAAPEPSPKTTEEPVQ